MPKLMKINFLISKKILTTKDIEIKTFLSLHSTDERITESFLFNV